MDKSLQVVKQMSKLNLILVEDNPADRALIQLLFKQLGANYNLTIFNNGEEAISYFTEAAGKLPSGVVLDLNIPKKNGFEVLKFIKSKAQYSDVPVVVLTSSTNLEDRENVIKQNAHFFSKSFKLPEMKRTLEVILHLFQ